MIYFQLIMMVQDYFYRQFRGVPSVAMFLHEWRTSDYFQADLLNHVSRNAVTQYVDMREAY